MRLVKAPVPDYVLRVELKYIKPAIWRRIIVPGSIRLGKLHVVLQLAMGWEGGHLHEFVFGETNYGEPDDFGFQSDPPMLNEARVTLAKALGGLKSFTVSARSSTLSARRRAKASGSPRANRSIEVL
ncbi:plasmid pRiA4b ORF-3 family protein [Paraburkholderia atlantica]|uniref:plasmid pRiA4b ORF-3 family protein n=1 Tax=Paraburkholderia atlantica TaxID=2654982 RepID=UPI003D23927C